MTDIESGPFSSLITLTADIVAAHVSHNSVAVSDLKPLIENVHTALARLGQGEPEPAPMPEPAVSIRSSVKHDYIVCLEDGKKLKMLKRHLNTNYNMTPEQYRARWNLPGDYPMVAPAYAATRRELALKIGLGQKAAVVPAVQPAVEPTVKPAAKPAAKPSGKAAGKPAGKAAAKPARKTAGKAAVEPAVEAAVKAVAKRSRKSAAEKSPAKQD
jgi:predicted transcriptional regulator